MPRILQLVNSLDVGEPQGQVRLLCQSMVAQGFEVSVCVLEPGRRETRDLAAAGIPVTCLEQRSWWDPIALARFRRHVRRAAPDLIHAWDFTSLVHLWAKIDVPWLASVWTNPRHLRPCIAQRLLRDARRIVTPTCELRELLTGWDIASKRLESIRPGVSPLTANGDDRDALLSEFGFPPEARLVGTGSALDPVDQVGDLVWAADLLHLIREEVRLLVIRGGPRWRQVDRFTRQLGAEDYVRLLAESDAAVPWLRHLDVYWRTGDPAAPPIDLLVAMGEGVPAVVSDTSAHRELMVPGVTGCLEPLGGRAAFTRATDRLLEDVDPRPRDGGGGPGSRSRIVFQRREWSRTI